MTPMWDAMLGSDEQRDLIIKQIEAGSPLGFFGVAMDVAYGALYLVS